MSLDRLIDDASQEAQRPQGFEAEVSRDVTDVEDMIWVTIPSFSDDLEYGPLRWMPRGELLPLEGDYAIVVVSDAEPEPEAWVPAWWPHSAGEEMMMMMMAPLGAEQLTVILGEGEPTEPGEPGAVWLDDSTGDLYQWMEE